MRKLASIRKIEEIKSIVDADKICAYRVDGWWVVDSVAKYKVGDLVVYYEIDSFLPVLPQFEFLRKSSFKRMGSSVGFRLRTIKLMGQISQGLLTPIPENINDPKEGDDLSDLLGIVKYEPPIPAQLDGKVKGNFPNFIPKSDEIRVQNFESEFGYLPLGEKVYISEKLEGSSATFFYNNGEFGVCSRNWELSETEDNSFWRAAKILSLREKLTNFGKNIALQGELLSPGVQGNIYNFKDINVFFFTAHDIDNNRRLSFDELKWVLFKLDLNMVPVLEFNYNLPVENLVENMLRYAEGKSVLNKEVNREGIVVRGMERNFSFKAISNSYLLGNKN
jgi:RNA ligase (TIGR02306 family)